MTRRSPALALLAAALLLPGLAGAQPVPLGSNEILTGHRLTESGGARFDVYQPAGQAPAKGFPLIVLVPGHHCQPENYASVTGLLVGRGFAVAQFEWEKNAELSAEKWDARLKAMTEALLNEAKRTGTPLKVDANRMGIMGHSLGGSVATLRAARDARFKALAVFGPGGKENGFLNEARNIKGAVIGIDGSLDRITPPEKHSGVIVDRANNPHRAHVIIKNGSHPNAPADFNADYIRDYGRPVWKPLPVFPFGTWAYDFPILEHIKPMAGEEQRKIAFPYLLGWFERFVSGKTELKALTDGTAGAKQLQEGILSKAKFSPALREAGIPLDIARPNKPATEAKAAEGVADAIRNRAPAAEGDAKRGLLGPVGELSRPRVRR